jgi:NAD(P)-dependent dehydrogenase (short-subunit alcohol dehydrogenase family)
VANVPVPDILVNNAGINVPQEFLEIDVDTFDKIFAIDVKGAFFVAQSVARRMREHGRGGAMVNVTSQAGHVGLIRRTVYCAAKHALEGLTTDEGDGDRVGSRNPSKCGGAEVRGDADDEAFLRRGKI